MFSCQIRCAFQFRHLTADRRSATEAKPIDRPGQIFSTHERSFCTVDPASRVGLTPSPTCQSGQGGRPQGDVAHFGNEAGRANCQPSSQPRWRDFLCLFPSLIST